MALKEASFVDEGNNLILYGNVGTGKIYIATAIGIATCSWGKTAWFFRMMVLINQLGEAHKQGETSRFFKQLAKQIS